MAYDVKKVLNDGLTIVYGLTDSQIADIEQEVYKDHPEYRVELSEIFEPVKLGPIQLKNKKTIAELILRHSKTPKADGRDFLDHYVFKHAKALECEFLMNRLPRSTSIAQRYRVSLIIDAIDKKKKYLYKDFEQFTNTVNISQHFNIFNWFNCGADFDVRMYSVIWLTRVPEEELAASLKEDGSFRENTEFYTVENGELVNKTSLLRDMIKKSPAELDGGKPVKEQEPEVRQQKAVVAEEKAEEKRNDISPEASEDAKVLYRYERLAEQGDVIAQFNCGTMYFQGKGTAVNKGKALYWYEKAAEQGHADAQAYCGVMYDKGVGTAVNKEKALYWYEKAAEQGHVNAQIVCRAMYLQGEGTAVNKEKALYWYEKAAEQGDVDAQIYCGIAYDKGEGTAVNKEKALYWYEKAAEQGDVNAQTCCGLMYFQGEGTAANKEKALCWYEKAAEQGNVDAQIACGAMYLQGEGTAANRGKALCWYEKAAEQGNVNAQFYCGAMYLYGAGTAVNKEKALYWLKKAAEQGLADAQTLLKTL